MKNERFCLDCGVYLKGRIDKKFCSDTCRCNFHNRKNRDDLSDIRVVNGILRQNHRILTECMGLRNERLIDSEELNIRGFRFSFMTHIRNANSADPVHFVYDISWKKEFQDERSILLRRNQSPFAE